MYLMREFKSELHPDFIRTKASPLLVGKLAVKEVSKFDFPRFKQSEIEGYDDISDEKLTELMIMEAKISITRKFLEHKKDGTDLKEEGEEDLDDEEAGKIKSPSMLIMACNMVEVLRLRR